MFMKYAFLLGVIIAYVPRPIACFGELEHGKLVKNLVWGQNYEYSEVSTAQQWKYHESVILLECGELCRGL